VKRAGHERVKAEAEFGGVVRGARVEREIVWEWERENCSSVEVEGRLSRLNGEVLKRNKSPEKEMEKRKMMRCSTSTPYHASVPLISPLVRKHANLPSPLAHQPLPRFLLLSFFSSSLHHIEGRTNGGNGWCSFSAFSCRKLCAFCWKEGGASLC